MIAVVKILNVDLADTDSITVSYEVKSPVGPTLNDTFTVNLAGITPAQAVTGIKNRVVSWVGSPQGGGVVITTSNVWIFGGPQ